MAEAPKPPLKRGCRVRISGLKTEILNGAEGCVVGAQDAESQRYPVKLLKPPGAVAAFPEGVKVKPDNLELVPQAQPAPAKPRDKPRKAQAGPDRAHDAAGRMAGLSLADRGAPGGGPGMDPSSWARGLSADQAAEWFVDCYRMRVDDDYVWGGGNLHGLYDPDGGPDTVFHDFLVFAKLAARNGVVPARWDWPLCLKKAGELLGYAFEKADAKEKYGGENVFSMFTGGRSLRATGEQVYGTSCMGGGSVAGQGDSSALKAVLREIKRPHKVPALLTSHKAVFDDVGGWQAWSDLRSALATLKMPGSMYDNMTSEEVLAYVNAQAAAGKHAGMLGGRVVGGGGRGMYDGMYGGGAYGKEQDGDDDDDDDDEWVTDHGTDDDAEEGEGEGEEGTAEK
ncbi:hypothetical protein HYH03_007913 [Edaphochlamys debaryana]|uniref:Uncharacterized protein n=1 Tax=Edaphochlamys debaryana TaxID=47281 RepID=A0A835Y4H8_9CHLO|nr:hypothetical protein HYH03_007913 [Edaphochlamys debaryana]|eukprot:KAG2493986.1 hypothetical protein HYH03_007913 [Edaphochlamys debaryana]